MIGSSTMSLCKWNCNFHCSTLLTIGTHRFTDRDLMMRFRGGGVGHASTREATNFFKQDRDSCDKRRPVAEEEDDDCEETHAQQSRTDRDDEEEDYGYNRGQFSDPDEEEEVGEGDQWSEDEFGPEDDGGNIDEFMDDLGYGDM